MGAITRIALWWGVATGAILLVMLLEGQSTFAWWVHGVFTGVALCAIYVVLKLREIT